MTASTEPPRAAPAGARAAQGRVPDFFLVGHPKCGTTALYDMLAEHPQVFTPELREPAFFAGELPREDHRTTLPASLDEYRSLFADAAPGQLVGERSAMYLWSATAAGRIAAAQPAARIVAILREPASFLRSLHLQNLQSRYETETDLRLALELEDARRRGERIPRGCKRPQALLYSEYVRFVEQLRRFHAVFAPEQVLVLIYDDYRADNEATVRRVLGFVGAEEGVPIAPTEANTTVRIRSQQLDELVHSVSVGRGPVSHAVKASVKALTPRPLRRRALKAVQRRLILAPPPPIDDRLMLELRRRYQPEVVALSEYVGRDLVSLWGYDRLD
ncbi:MAG: sulfotransferase family protein [Solirubrobacteraceae bacterium]